VAARLLLVVDVQNGFVNDNTRHVVRPIANLVKKWQTEKLGPVVFSRFINLAGSPWERLRDWHELKNEPDTSLHEAMPQYDAYVFKKSTYSAWSPEVQQVCGGHKVDEVVLCGIDTNECVLATAIDIFESNLTPVLVEDCCASGAGEDMHNTAIKLIKKLIGQEQVKMSNQL
jgi:nicotinamidase-related amidase